NSGDRTIAPDVTRTPFQTIAALPALAVPAPIRPPTKAWELLDGIPPHQVMRFQEIAPTSAANSTRGVTMDGSIRPVPMVCATCKPKTRKATKLKNAAQMTAAFGGRTRVDTIVAI